MRKKILQFSICWLIITIIISVILGDSYKGAHSILVVLTTFSYALCVYCWVKMGCRVVSVFTFFIAYAYLCNCAQSLLYVLGVPEEFLTAYYNVSFIGVTNSLRFQLICIAALNVGACIGNLNNKHCISSEQQVSWYKNLKPENKKADRVLFYLLLFLLAGTLYSALEIARVRSSMSYHDWMYEGYHTVDSRFYFVYFFSFISLLFVFKKQHVWIVYSSWIFLIGLFMMLGLRTQAIPYVSFFLITLPVTNSGLFQKKYLPFWFVGGFVFIILLGVISSTRTNESVDLSEANREAGVAVSFYVALADVGASAETVGLTMDLCDNKGMPHYQSILYSVLTVIPKRVMKLPDELFQVPGWEDMSSPGSHLSYRAGLHGAGYSFIAEAYLNYGWLGWIFILFYGFLIARMENYAYEDIMRGNYFKITFLLYLSRQVFFARGDLCLGEIYIEYMIFTAILFKIFRPSERLFLLNKKSSILVSK